MRQSPLRLFVASQPMAEGVPQHMLDVPATLDPDRSEIDVACPRASALWAMATGVPVVATRGRLPELFEEGRTGIERLSRRHMAAEIRAVYEEVAGDGAG
jgi:glycosyltransferase involved in cell wall biosynthesis